MAEPRVIVGPDQIRPGKNTSGSDMVQGTLVKLKASPTVTDEVDISATGATEAIYGVAMEAITNGSWGNIQIAGRALVRGSAAIAIGARVTSTTGGEAVTASAGNAFCGVACTLGANDALFEVELIGPGGAEMPG